MTDVMPAATIEAAAALAGGTGTGRGVNWILRGAQVWLGLIVVLTVVYPWLPFVEDPMRVGAGPPQTGPSGEFWFGTSTLGQDVFAQVLEGGRISLRVAAIGTIVGIGLGGLLGLLAGYLRGWVDWVVRLIINVTLSVPALVLVTFIVAVRDQSLFNVTLAICILAVPAIARIARASTLQVAEREYVKAAEVIGARKLTILWREVLPNVMPTLVSFSFLTTGIILVAESSLSFLGLSVKQPAITWGSIIAEGRIAFDKTPHMVFLPGLVLFLTVLSLNFIGDHLLKRYDIRESNL
jgi:peptide/nickel transport system permease protein